MPLNTMNNGNTWPSNTIINGKTLPSLEQPVLHSVLQSPHAYSMYNNNNYHCNLLSDFNSQMPMYGVNNNSNIFQNTNNNNAINSSCMHNGNNYLLQTLVNASYVLRIGMQQKHSRIFSFNFIFLFLCFCFCFFGWSTSVSNKKQTKNRRSR